MGRPNVQVLHPRGIKRRRRYRPCRDYRQHFRQNSIQEIVRRHTDGNKHFMGGHYGALYWALCACFQADGVVVADPTFSESAHRWRHEITGGDGHGSRAWRPMHAALWDWAVDIAVREWESARDGARKEALQRSAA